MEVRIDKFIWAVRLYKTRSVAAEEIKNGAVLLNDRPVKPAHTVAEGDELSIRRNPIWRRYRIKTLLSNRVSAKLVETYITDITPQAELDKLEQIKLMPGYDRPRGKGRPSKKERRDMDKFGWH